jgi:hypothetical protein
MKKCLSFFLSPLKVLGNATLAVRDSKVAIAARAANEVLPTTLPRAMMLVYELVPRRSGA